MAALDGRLDLANLALILVLGAAVAGLWLGPVASMTACAAAVIAFNVAFVPPRGRLTVDVHQHVLLLGTMLAVSWIVVLLMARQRRLAGDARMHATRVAQLQALGDALRDADDPRACAPLLGSMLSGLTGSAAVLAFRDDVDVEGEVAEPGLAIRGDASSDEQAGLRLAVRDSMPLGAGTGRWTGQPAWYLPMRGREASHGAVMLRLPEGWTDPGGARDQAQALCDRMGLALERAGAVAAAARAREAERLQALRGTLLASISHDHRTPLATILGAASSLQEQGDRLDPGQRARLAATIVDEATQLARLTGNTLQLARLDAPGLELSLDWESVAELAGTVVGRLRRRDPSHRVEVSVAPDLPLVRCDAVLVVQLIDNLVSNALAHGAADAPVEVSVRREGDRVLIEVCDRGPGLPVDVRARPFEPFRAGDRRGGRRGAGVGLAVCRAIARVHGGELAWRDRPGGGTCFACTLPIESTPDVRDRQADGSTTDAPQAGPRRSVPASAGISGGGEASAP
jgi:two-component system sensor histidine kinase KdpD